MHSWQFYKSQKRAVAYPKANSINETECTVNQCFQVSKYYEMMAVLEFFSLIFLFK